MADSVKIKIEADNSEYKKAIKELSPLAQNASDGVGSAMTKATTAAEKANKGYTMLKNTMANLASQGIAKLTSAITGSLDAAISRVDTIEAYERTMAMLGYTTTEVAEAQEKLKASIEQLPTSTDAIYSLQQRFAPLCETMEDATEITIALNDATLAGGQGMEAASRAADQWYQMLAAGKPDLESMKIINETMPAQLDMISKSLLGETANWQDLNKAWQSGAITADQVKTALIDLDENGLKVGEKDFASFADQAVSATAGLGTSLDILKGRVGKNLAEIIQAIGTDNIAKPINAMIDLINEIGGVCVKVVTYIKEHWSSIAPVLEKVSIAVIALVGAFGALKAGMMISNTIKKVTIAFQGLTAIMSMYSAGASFSTVMTTGLTTAQKVASTVIGLCTGKIKLAEVAQWAWNAALSANPIGIVILAIAAFVAAIVLLWKKSETFREIVTAVWDAVKEKVMSVVSVIVEVWRNAWEVIKAVWDFVQPYFQALWDAIVVIFSYVVEFFSTYFTNAWEAIKFVWDGVVGFFRGIWNGIVAIFSGIKTFFSTWFGGAFNTIKSFFNLENFKKVFHESIIGGLQAIKDDATKMAGEIWKSIKDAFGGVIKLVFGAGGQGGGDVMSAFQGYSAHGALSPYGFGITSPYGMRKHPISGQKKMHTGVDIGAAYGTPIQSPVNGTVTRVQSSTTGYGKNVIITGIDGLQYLFGHMSGFSCNYGQQVWRGKTIGYVGSTGASTGPHLHFEVRSGGSPINPMPYLNKARGYATGGFPALGEMFMANEAGIEMMGRFGRRNVIANNMQIIEGIRQGVFSGFVNAARSGGSGKSQAVNVTQNFYKEQIAPSDIKRASRKGIRSALMGGIG